MSQPLVVAFQNNRGSLTWILPSEAQAALQRATPEIRAQVLQIFSTNMDLVCTAILSGFGNPAKINELNLLLHDLKELVDREN